MMSSSIIIIILFLFLLFFMFYKRDMLIKMFSIDVTSSANQFQEQLEETADLVIKRLEDQISHFEALLEEANSKNTNLDNKILMMTALTEKAEEQEKLRIEKSQQLEEKNKELEEKSSYLENLLEIINEKSSKLENIIQLADGVIEKEKIKEQEEMRVKTEEKNKRMEEHILHLEELLEKTTEQIRPMLTATNVIVPEIVIEEPEIINSYEDMDDQLSDANILPSGIKEEYKGTIHGDKRSSIVEMADLGYDINEIAKTTGISKGEIILLLQLNKK